MCRTILLGWFLLLSVSAVEVRPRIAIITDDAREQRCAFVRLLLYTNQLDLVAILHEGEVNRREWLGEKIDLYGKSHAKLKKHDSLFPTAEVLRNTIGEASAERLAGLMKTSTKERLHVLGWRGGKLIAAALRLLESHPAEERVQIGKNLRVHVIGTPEPELLEVANRWPEVEILVSVKQNLCLGMGWKEILPDRYEDVLSAEWMKENILKGHGSLCASYEAHAGETDGHRVGDVYGEPASLTFLHLIPNGLGSSVHPTFGGWGGRYQKMAGQINVWEDAPDEGDAYRPFWRWLSHIQGDWAVRADWCVKSYKGANHGPDPAVNGSKASKVLGVRAAANQEVALDASATTDPDDHKVVKAWWYYSDPSTYKDTVELEEPIGAKVTFKVPFDTRPHTHHVMLTARDGGNPGVYAYRRIVIQAEAGKDSTPPIVAPTLKGKVLGTSSVSLSWTSPEDLESGIQLYQLYRDGELLKELVEENYKDESLKPGTAATYHVVALNGARLPSPESNKLPMETERDTTGPELREVRVGSQTLTLIFDEAVSRASAEAPANYSIGGAVKVLSAKLDQDGKTVTLTTSPLPLESTPCWLTIRAVTDRAEPPNAVGVGVSYGFLYEDTE